MQQGSIQILPISFKAEGFRLHGHLHLPAAEKPPVVIGSHGLFSDANSPKQITLARRLTEIGIAYFRFDHRGCGQSEGIFQMVTSLAGRVADLDGAVQTIQNLPETGDEIALFGSSMGGATILSYAAGHPEIRSLVTVAAPLRSGPILEAGKKSGDLRGLPLSFYENRLQFDISGRLSEISRLMIFHGDQDETVPCADAHKLYAAVSDPKELIIQKKGDHTMSALQHQVWFMRAAVRWFRQWFPDPAS